MAEQKVADQHAGLIAPQHARRDLAAAHVAFVDDIVVEQRRRMHEFDAGGEFDMAVALVAAHAGGREHQHRAQSLAARRNQMIGDLGNGRDVRAGALKDKLIGALEVGPDELQKTVEASVLFFSLSSSGMTIPTEPP